MERINHRSFKDERGSYTPISTTVLDQKWEQCSVSINDEKFTFRGLHYQTNPPQTKYIKVVQGSIVDFMVDLETGGYSCICSLTFYGLNCELEVPCSQRCLNKGLSYLFIYFKNVKFYFLKEFAC